jgi:hypothetical protein
VDGDPLGTQAQRGGGQVDELANVGQAVGEVGLAAAEGVGALHRAPLAAAVAEDHDVDGRLPPVLPRLGDG